MSTKKLIMPQPFNAIPSAITSLCAILFICIPFHLVSGAKPVLANSYTVRHGFCLDYAGRNKSILYSDFHYEVAKDYEYCMSNADRLIQKKEEAERARKDYIKRQELIKQQELRRLRQMPLEDLFY